MLKSFLIFTITLFTSCQISSQHNVSLDIKLGDHQITKKTIQYATVDYSNPIEIWEEEFEVGGLISTFIDYSLPKKLKLDVYGPNDNQIRPAFIIFHGGAFLPTRGSKKDASIVKLAKEFAMRGYRVFSVEYRNMNILAPSFLKGGYMATQDAKASLRYIANHSKELFINPNQFFLGGISAGAITALNTAFLDQGEPILGREAKFDVMYGCLDCVGESKLIDFKVLGIVNISGGIYDLNILENNSIPVISFHGDLDNIVPVKKGIPFNSVSDKYNSFLEKLNKIALKYGYPKLAKEFEEGKVSEIIGSREIHKKLIASNKNSTYIEVPQGTHYLVLSKNNVFKQQGIEIITKTSNFMYSLL